MKAALAFFVALCLSISAICDDITSVGGIEFGSNAKDFDRISVINVDAEGRNWFKPFPSGDFLGIPVSPKNYFYFRVTPKTSRVFELGLCIDHMLPGSNVRAALEQRYLSSGVKGFKTQTKVIAYSLVGASELYSVTDLELAKAADAERHELEEEQALAEKAQASAAQAAAKKPEEEAAQRAKLDLSGEYGLKFGDVFNRIELGKRIVILSEKNSADVNMLWFRPRELPSQKTIDYFTSLVRITANASPAEKKALLEGREFVLRFDEMPQYYALVTHSSRKIYEIGVVSKYTDAGTLNAACAYYSSLFKQAAEKIESDKSGTQIFCIERIRISIDKKTEKNQLFLAVQDMKTERLDSIERQKEAEDDKTPQAIDVGMPVKVYDETDSNDVSDDAYCNRHHHRLSFLLP